VQDAFLRAWRAAPTLRPEHGSARTWLLALVHRRAIDLIRRNAGRARLAGPPDTVPVPVCAGADPWEAVELAYFGGYQAAEIAARQGVPPGTAKGRLRLGLRALQQDLAQLAPAERTPA